MNTKNKTDDQKEMSFIEKARRAQIVACAIETIAEVGYAQASIGQIAKRANVSKRSDFLSFCGQDELLEQVVTEYYIAYESFMRRFYVAKLLPETGSRSILKRIWSLSWSIGRWFCRCGNRDGHVDKGGNLVFGGYG